MNSQSNSQANECDSVMVELAKLCLRHETTLSERDVIKRQLECVMDPEEREALDDESWSLKVDGDDLEQKIADIVSHLSSLGQPEAVAAYESQEHARC